MAQSGSHFYEDFYPDYELWFRWRIVEQNAVTNRSRIEWVFLYYDPTSSYFTSDALPNKRWAVNVQGQTFSGVTPSDLDEIQNVHPDWVQTVDPGNGLAPWHTFTLAHDYCDIPHNVDGTKTFSYSASIDFEDFLFIKVTVGLIKLSSTGTLDQIPRTSTLSGPAGVLGSAQTLTITPKVDGFRHKISYKCGTASGYVLGSDTETGEGTSITWTPPLSLASQNTAGTSVTVDFVLGTYAPEGRVGYDYISITYTMPESVRPAVNFKLTDISGVGDIYGTPVQGLSRISIDVTATPSYGSPIESYSISANGDKWNESYAVTGVLKAAGDSVVMATATDERGRTGSVSYTMRVKAYDQPKITALRVLRCNADGTESDHGDYVRIAFSASLTDIGGQGKNAARYTLRYKKGIETEFTELPLAELTGRYTVTDFEILMEASGDSSHDIEIVAEDSHTRTVRSTSASTAFTLMNWGANGTSIGLGKVAEKAHTLEVAMASEFTGDMVQRGNAYTAHLPGTPGEIGFVAVAQIAILSPNANAPITFYLSRRNARSTMTVHVRFADAANAYPDLESITYEGANYDAYLYPYDLSTWVLYVAKTSKHDAVTLQRWTTSPYMDDRVEVSFLDIDAVQVDTVPTPYYKATPAMLDSLRDYIYPVGSIYMSYSHVNPADLFGGTWVRIENAFLWGVDSSGAIGLTGGAKEVTLSVNQIPAHSHGSVYSGNAAGTKSYPWLASGGTAMAYGTVSTGGGQAHNNMPPYVQVSIWRRTA